MSKMTLQDVSEDLHRLGYHGYASAIEDALDQPQPEVVECDNCGLTTGCMCLAVGIGSGPRRCPACSQPTRNAIPPLRHQPEPADAVSDDMPWDDAKVMARKAIYVDGRGMIGADRRFLEDRVARAIQSAARHARGVPDGWKPSTNDVHAWRNRNDLDMISLDECRTAIEDARSMRILAAQPTKDADHE